MRDLPSLMARAFGAPLLIAPAKLETVLHAIGPRLLGEAALASNTPPERLERLASALAPYQTQAGTPVTQDGVAVLPIVGTMVRRGSWVDAESGTASYGGIEAMVRDALADPEVTSLLLDIDTMGGEAGGVFDTADAIASMGAKSKKKIWCCANDAALSAGYALAASADQIWITRTGEVGSIGVVAAHVDRSQADKAAGLKWTYIYAGKHKIDGNPHAPLTDAVQADVQAEIDRLYGMFVMHVAKARKLSPEAVAATEARVYSAEQAVSLGLADKIGTLAEAASALAGTVRRGNASPIRRGMTSPAITSTTMEAGVTDTPLIEPGAEGQPASPSAETDVQTEAQATGGAELAGTVAETISTRSAENAEALAQRAADLATIGAFATSSGVEFDLPTMIREGVTADQAKARVFDTLAARDRELPTLTMHPLTANAGVQLGSKAKLTRQDAASFWDRIRARKQGNRNANAAAGGKE